MKNLLLLILSISFLSLTSCTEPTTSTKTTPLKTGSTLPKNPNTISIQHTDHAPKIDGFGNDNCWKKIDWLPIDQKWIGKDYTPEDFSGKYKLRWTTDFIYILAEIRDDKLIDIHKDGLHKYWDDDCVEIFIDEDRSKGPHLKSYNAFAYHIALDYKVADYGIDEKPHYYNDHVESKRTQKGDVYTWEMKMKVFDDTYVYEKQNTSVKLNAGKEIGFAIAYCDNDNSKERENFIGSIFVPGEDKNQGYKDAGVFGSFTLVK